MSDSSKSLQERLAALPLPPAMDPDARGTDQSPSATARPLRILSLDGGGIRGLASLFILQDLMDRIKVKKKLAATPLPCEWFDLIVGTSTGGLIALMLGRLKMPVNNAIDAYKDLAEQVFGEKTRQWLGKPDHFATSSEPRYSGEKLEAAIRKIAGDTKLADPDAEPTCRVAVVAVMKSAVAKRPDLMRTCTTDVPTYDCSVIDAARATSAATLFFPPVKVQIKQHLQVTYLDGSLGYSNPTGLAVEEAEHIWGPDRKIGCIVSIGTGISPYVHFEGNKHTLARKLLDLFADCRSVHENIDSRFGGMQKRIYFRFDPPTDLASIGLDEWEKLNDVAELAHAYVQGDKFKISDCVTAIAHPTLRQNLVTLRTAVLADSQDEVSDSVDRLDERSRDSSKRLAMPSSAFDFPTVTEMYKQGELKNVNWTKYKANAAINGRVSLILGDITKLKVDMIVNATNRRLLGAIGVSGAIHDAAGPELLEACWKLNGCEVGDAKVIPSFDLPSRLIAHTSGPRYDSACADQCAIHLASCYKTCLKLCKDYGGGVIAFPCISTGFLRYPPEEQAHVACKTVRDVLEHPEYSKITQVIFCQFTTRLYNTYLDVLPVYFPKPGSSNAGKSI